MGAAIEKSPWRGTVSEGKKTSGEVPTERIYAYY